MSDLRLLDPTHADDPAFDPDGPQARLVRAAALRARPVPAPAPPRLRRRLALAVAAVGAAVIAITVGTSTAPPDARAALNEAARATAAADSGRVVITIVGEDARRGIEADVRTEIRFQGDDLELVLRERGVLPGGRVVQSARTVRLIDGIAYDRDDTRPGGRFQRIGKVDPVSFAVAGQMDDDGLVALVRSTRGVRTEEAGDVTTYRGTTTAGAVEDAAPTAHGRSQGGEWDREVGLEVAVGDDGLIRHVIVRDGGITRTTRYLDLGEPQAIERP